MNGKHKIRQFTLDVDFEDADANAARSEIKHMSRVMSGTKLYQALEHVLDRMDGDGSFVSIPRLELELGLISAAQLDAGLVQLIESKLRRALQIRNWKEHRVPPRFKFTEAFSKFLQTGHLPWDSPVARLSDLEEELVQLKRADLPVGFVNELRRLLTASRQCFRLATQFSENMFLHLIMQWFCLPFSQQKKYRSLIRKQIDPDQRILIKREILQSWAHKKSPLLSLEGPEPTKPTEETITKDLMVFLREGVHERAPIMQTISELEEALLRLDGRSLPEGWLAELKELLKQPMIRERLVRRFSANLFDHMLLHWFELPQSLMTVIQKACRDISDAKGRTAFMESLLLLVANDRDFSLQWEDRSSSSDLQQIVLEATENFEWTRPKTSEDVWEPLDTSISMEDRISVRHAGVILVHPFLSQLFKNLELTKSDQFISLDSREKAVHLLHYLATGDTDPEEPETTLFKVLCGMDISDPISRHVEFSKEELEEADHCLKSVIRHWSILKNATPDGLRETFIQRSGRLEKCSTGWNLDIEKKSMDILLDKLPWSIATIKLPWLDHLILVNWR